MLINDIKCVFGNICNTFRITNTARSMELSIAMWCPLVLKKATLSLLSFYSKILDKIRDLKKIKDEKGLNFEIEVDGGINFENNSEVINAGANILVSGTTIFKDNNGDIKKNIELLRS